jgi:sigma-B regulation protein RsbU (phosphoserine phosphatase)
MSLGINTDNHLINNIKVGDHGFAFLLSKNGRFITHPLKEFVLQKTIFSVSRNSFNKRKINLKKVLSKGLSGVFIAYPKFLNREKHWVYYTQLTEIEWTVIFAMPYKQLFKPLYFSILKLLLISAIGIIIIFLLIRHITNILVNPLSEVTAKLKKFTNETGNIEINSLNEIKLVSESLKTLKIGYERNKIKQSEEEEKNYRQMQDLLQASEIQQSLIKTDFSVFSEIKEIDLFAIYKPARIVGGDLFDFFFDDNDNLIFTMGDVSGKGVSAAFFMSIAQTIISNSARKFKTAGEIVKNVNNELYTTNKHQFFLTLFLGIFNIKTGVLNYCNAAHTPTYILKPTGKVAELDQSHGLPLGLYPNKDYSDSKVILKKGESILLYTDGITELRNENDLHFGTEKLVDNLHRLVELKPKELVVEVEQALKLFKGEASQADDITLMNIRYNS